MTGLLVFVGWVIWLGLGGYAYGVLLGTRAIEDETDDTDGDTVVFGLIICAVLGPFMAGWAFSEQMRDRTK